jgi:hypothetical protein
VSDETTLSKRERQKLRREAKREEERRQQARARRQRTIAFGLVGVVLAGLVGLAVARFVQQNRADRQAAERAAAQLTEFGCTDAETRPNLGAGHLSGNELVANPPQVLYPDRPTTSGRHLGSVALTGVYDKVIDERLLIHNLEHGYVNVFYGAGADPAQVDELRSFGQEQIDGRFPKTIVSPWQEELPQGANFAFTAWDVRQLCAEFSPDVLLTFLNDFHGLSGTAPEKTVQAHTNASQSGVLDPNADEGPLLFPPLGEGGLEPVDEVPMEGLEDATEEDS